MTYASLRQHYLTLLWNNFSLRVYFLTKHLLCRDTDPRSDLEFQRRNLFFQTIWRFLLHLSNFNFHSTWLASYRIEPHRNDLPVSKGQGFNNSTRCICFTGARKVFAPYDSSSPRAFQDHMLGIFGISCDLQRLFSSISEQQKNGM